MSQYYIMVNGEQQGPFTMHEIMSKGFSSDSYKPGTTLTDGSYSLLVQYYVQKHGGQLVNGIDTPVQVLVRVHESDQIKADDNTTIFDPWRTYPKADNVVHYGK